MMTNVHVFHCSEVECRWGRGVGSIRDENADESLEAAAGICALDGRQAQCRCLTRGPGEAYRRTRSTLPSLHARLPW